METTDDRSLSVKVVAAVFLPVASVAVILRCYVRLRIVRAFGWDDGMMVFALLFYAMFAACMIGGSLYGTGKRFIDLTPRNRVIAMEYWWLCEVAYCFASVGCKVSVCIFLMRIAVKRLHHWILYTVMLLTVATGLVFMFLMLLQCKPLEFFWTKEALDPNIKGTCMDINIIIIMTYIYSAFAALCDFTVGILPIFLVRKLNMRRKTKLAVVGILSMACIASCAVIIRLPFVKTFADPDFLYATVDIALWSNIEMGLGITAGSLATLHPLLRLIRGTTTDKPYSSTSPMPGRSLRRHGASRDGGFVLGSLDYEAQGRLRPDKVATVTTVQTSPVQETPFWARSSSEERLQSEGSSRTEDSEMGLSVQRTFQVVRTPADD